MNTHHYICPACHEENRFKTFATDRVELEREKGEQLRVTCGHCHDARTIHPNDVFAKPNVIFPIIAGVMVLIPMVFLFRFGWIIVSTLLIGAPFAVWAAQQKSASGFNNYRIKRS